MGPGYLVLQNEGNPGEDGKRDGVCVFFVVEVAEGRRHVVVLHSFPVLHRFTIQYKKLLWVPLP